MLLIYLLQLLVLLDPIFLPALWMKIGIYGLDLHFLDYL